MVYRRDARLPIEAPLGHMGLKGGLKAGPSAETPPGSAGQILYLRGAGLKVGESYMPHGGFTGYHKSK